MNPLFLSLVLLLLTITTTTATPTPKIGVTFDPTTPNLPPLDSIITSLVHYEIPTVRLVNPTPSSIHAFSSTNITLLISIPNTFLHSFASNQSSASTWISNNILPFHNTTRISLISIASTTRITRFHLPALRNLYSNLQKLGVVNVPVSVTFPFETIVNVTNSFMPSRSVLSKPKLLRDLVRFLKSTNSSFLVTVYPYKAYRSSHDEIPLESALLLQYRVKILQSESSDGETRVVYKNLFEVMVDALVSTLESVDKGNVVPVIVAGTGWPCETIDEENDGQWASVYLSRLMEYLKKSDSRSVDEVYVYELLGDEWGIMEKNLSLKYDLDFSSGSEAAEKAVILISHKKSMEVFGLIMVFWWVGFLLCMVLCRH